MTVGRSVTWDKIPVKDVVVIRLRLPFPVVATEGWCSRTAARSAIGRDDRNDVLQERRGCVGEGHIVIGIHWCGLDVTEGRTVEPEGPIARLTASAAMTPAVGWIVQVAGQRVVDADGSR